MTNTKSDRTKQFILEKAAPVFNKNGYIGTSLSDVTEATGLTKGAIYGNFENKEDLAYYSFYFNVSKVLVNLKSVIDACDSSIDKLKSITEFYRNYYRKNIKIGGCPILNVGIDANHTNPKLHKAVNKVIVKIEGFIIEIVNEGIEKKEIKAEVDSEESSQLIFSMIEGGIFTSMIMKNEKYLTTMMDHLDEMIMIKLAK